MTKPLFPYANKRVTQGFKAASSYGPHEGIDYGRVGHTGAQNCGLLYRAAGDGEIVHTSFSNKDYGNLVVVRYKTVFGDRWVRYCHCTEIRLRSGMVKAGDIIGTMGSTGNSTACHLHLDVLKKVPSHWRFYSKNIDDWYENPEVFFDTELVESDTIPPVEITDKTPIPIGGEWGSPELQALRSMLNDMRRDTTNAKADLAKNKVLLTDEKAITAALNKDNQDLRDALKNKITELQRVEQKVGQLQEKYDTLQKEKIGEPLFVFGKYGIFRLP